MHKFCKTALGLTTAGIGFLTINTFSAFAATVNFEIDFFEENDLVGSGSFSYDDQEQWICFQITNSFDCYTEPELTAEYGDLSIREIENILYANANFISNPLTDFSATIYGVSWTDINGGSSAYVDDKWWADDGSGQLPGHISVPGGGSNAEYGSWFFGDPYFGMQQFTMNFKKEQVSDNFSTGSWSLSVVNPPAGLPTVAPDANYSELGGIFATFEVRRVEGEEDSQSPDPTSIPEYSSILGMLVTMTLCFFTKRKLTN